MQFFTIVLTTAHIAWLLLNLCGIAHFVATTLAFVQQKAREVQRERYTANVVVPVEMKKRLRQQLFLIAGPEFVKESCPPATAGGSEPTVYLGDDFSNAGCVEVPLKPRKGGVLTDVRMMLVRWAVCRWLRRCTAANNNQQKQIGGLTHEPLLLFPPRLDVAPEPEKGLCRRRGGLPLTRMERMALRYAFKFRRKRDARELPTPDQILEELADKAAVHIDRIAPVAFDAAFDELTRYHRFLLSVHASRSTEGEPFNYAAVPFTTNGSVNTAVSSSERPTA